VSQIGIGVITGDPRGKAKPASRRCVVTVHEPVSETQDRGMDRVCQVGISHGRPNAGVLVGNIVAVGIPASCPCDCARLARLSETPDAFSACPSSLSVCLAILGVLARAARCSCSEYFASASGLSPTPWALLRHGRAAATVPSAARGHHRRRHDREVHSRACGRSALTIRTTRVHKARGCAVPSGLRRRSQTAKRLRSWRSRAGARCDGRAGWSDHAPAFSLRQVRTPAAPPRRR
jgi:hypothetical protein